MSGAALSLRGRKVVVIGGASGIGFAVAELALQAGAQVVIASRDVQRVRAATARLPGSAGGSVDLREEAGVARFFDALGAFDHLAITAGDWDTPMFAPLRDLDLAAAREGFAVRFWGVLAAVKHACRVIAPAGSITLTSGMLVHRPARGMPMVAATGGAVEHLTRGLAVDLAPLRVNAVCPGITLTEQVTRMMPPQQVQSFVAPLPLPRGATPAEAGTAYIYAMLNGYVTGQVLPVDGGGLLV